MKYNQAIVVYSLKEIQDLARKMGLEKSQYKICSNRTDLLGQRLPTEKLLFLLPSVHADASLRGLIQ